VPRKPEPDSILGLISGASVSIWFMHSMLDLFKNDVDGRFAMSWLLVYGPYIHSNRNQLQAEFMLTDRDWLFMVDNDITFEPKDVLALFELADEKGPGVYSGPYLLENASLVCGPWDNEIEMVYHPMLSLPEKPCEIGVVGAGFTLIHRKVFEAIGENAFSPIGEHAGEDLSMSWRAREAGYTPWLVPACNPGHFKSVTIYPSQTVRNIVGEDINLVQVDEKLKTINEIMVQEAKEQAAAAAATV
jgi:hypothetical protein